MVAAKCFSLLLVFSLHVEALSLYEYLVGVQRNNTAMLQSQCHHWKSANVDHTRQEMASPRAWRPTAQSSKSMGNRLEFFQAPSIISGFHLDIFTSDYPSHRVHPQYWQTRLRQYRVRPCNYWKHLSQKFLKNLKHLGTCWIEKAGGRLEHHRRVRSLELARAEERRVWLWSASLSPLFGEPSIFLIYGNLLPLRLG